MSIKGEPQFPQYWKDTGCHLHPSCLACPRAVCIEDEQDEERRRRKRQAQVRRTVELMGTLQDKRAVAKALGLSKRAVERRLQAAKERVA